MRKRLWDLGGQCEKVEEKIRLKVGPTKGCDGNEDRCEEVRGQATMVYLSRIR